MGLFPRDRNLSRPLEQVELAVHANDFRTAPEDVQIRLDAFLKLRLPWRSRTSVQRLIDDGYVLVAPAAPGYAPSEEAPRVERRCARHLRHGARVVVVIPPELRLPEVLADPGSLSILHEDADVLAVDKPAGQAVHPSGRSLSCTLIQDVHARYAQDGELEVPIRLCHRIDRETSGVVLLAKGARAHRHIRKQFEERTVEKEYLAIVQGSPLLEGGTIDFALGSARGSSIGIKMAPMADGLPSRTEWKVVSRHAGCTLVACRLHTGRQHQIRVHMEAIGNPLVGDKLYGYDEQYFQRAADGTLTDDDLRALELPRQALHHHRLVFHSSSSGQRIEVVSPLARDLAAHLE
jgi:23S rRNA pseudouridine1911/1915/1917 synthase